MIERYPVTSRLWGWGLPTLSAFAAFGSAGAFLVGLLVASIIVAAL